MEAKIVAEIRNYLSRDKGIELKYDLSRFRYLVLEYIPTKYIESNQHIWFEANQNGIVWDDKYELELTMDKDGKEIYQFENSFKVNGTLGYSFQETEHEVKVSLSLTYFVFKYPDQDSIHEDHMILYDEHQTVERKFSKTIEGELRNLNILRGPESLGIPFSRMTDIWSKVDKANLKQVNSTNYFFWTDLYSDVELVIDLLGETSFYGNYLSELGVRYYRPEPRIHLSKYERQFLNKFSLTLHAIYGYWEKIAFVIYQFYRNEIGGDEHRLSFQNVIKWLKSKLDSSDALNSNLGLTALQWFFQFESNYHKKLRELRHPLVHYKSENELFKGGMYASFLNKYIESIQIDSEREELNTKMHELKPFLIDQVKKVIEGYDILVQLIEEK